MCVYIYTTHLLQQRKVETLDEVGVLNVTSQKLGLFHAQLANIDILAHEAGSQAVHIFIIRCQPTASLLCSVPAVGLRQDYAHR